MSIAWLRISFQSQSLSKSNLLHIAYLLRLLSVRTEVQIDFTENKVYIYFLFLEFKVKLNYWCRKGRDRSGPQGPYEDLNNVNLTLSLALVSKSASALDSLYWHIASKWQETCQLTVL